MSEDDKIEYFAVHIFNTIFENLQIYEPQSIVEVDGGDFISESCVKAIYTAVNFRRKIYSNTWKMCVADTRVSFSKSISEFYLHFLNGMEKLVFIPHINVFEKILTSFTLLTEMCIYTAVTGYGELSSEAPSCWIIYFDTELSGEFFADGGWNELENYVDKYRIQKLFSFTEMYFNNQNEYAHALFKNAMINYNEPFLIRMFINLYHRIRKQQDEVCCQRCLPLFVVLHGHAYPKEILDKDGLYMEGYIQFFLRLFNDVELCDIMNDVKASLAESENYVNSDDTSECQMNNESMYDHSYHYIESTKFITKTTLKLFFERCCSETASNAVCTYNTNVKVEGQEIQELCIFCGKNVTWKSFETTKLQSEIKKIKKTIGKVAKLNEPPEIDLLDYWKIDFSCKSSVESSSNPCDVEFKECYGDKQVLRLFYVLASDNGKKSMRDIVSNANLTDLKDTAKNKPTEENGKKINKKKKKRNRNKNITVNQTIL